MGNQINKPTDYFNTKLYTGNGSTQSITGVGFQPDFVWLKDRSVGTSVASHHLFNSIVGAGKFQVSNLSDPEGVEATTLTSFDSDGFSVSTDTSTNNSGSNLVSWNWLGANGTASNTDGSITSTVSANTTSGFSIVKFTTPSSGTSTVGHGLNVVPKVWIHKRLNDSENWQIYHHSIGNTKKIMLNSTNAASTSSIWQDTTPTSSLMYLGTAGSTVFASSDYIAYCFAEKKGFSKFGSYTGNGSTDGTFIYTGFKPAFTIVKPSSFADNWEIYDNKRNTFNTGSTKRLKANSSEAESDSPRVDFLSNGFKLRGTTGFPNTNGETFIYMCFAENPLVSSAGVPCTAR